MTGGNIMGIRRCCWKHSSTPHDSMEPAIARQTGSILEKPRDEAGWIDSTEPKSFRKRFSSFRCVEALNRLYAPAIHRLFRLPTRTDAVNNYDLSYFVIMLTREFGSTGVKVPVIGQGTWKLTRDGLEALRAGFKLGMTHIDTAEMYTGSEEVIRESIQQNRDKVFIVSKVLPSNASY